MSKSVNGSFISFNRIIADLNRKVDLSFLLLYLHFLFLLVDLMRCCSYHPNQLSVPFWSTFSVSKEQILKSYLSVFNTDWDHGKTSSCIVVLDLIYQLGLNKILHDPFYIWVHSSCDIKCVFIWLLIHLHHKNHFDWRQATLSSLFVTYERCVVN